MRSITTAMLLTAALVAGAVAEEPEANYGQVQHETVTRLLAEDFDAVLAAESDAPGSVRETLRRLDLAVRAGRHGRARDEIKRLTQLEGLNPHGVLSGVADDLIDREEDDLVRVFLESHPRANPGWGYVFLKRWVQRDGLSVVDPWLAERQPASWGYWARERLRLRKDAGAVQELLDEFAEEVRKHPHDAAKAQDFLGALNAISERPDLDWMGSVCRPPLAVETARLGHALVNWSPNAAVELLERAYAMPFTDEDQSHMRQQRAVWIENVERSFRLGIQRDLVRALKGAGRLEEAQKLLEELTTALEDGGVYLPLARLSGQVQAETGGRTIERRVLAAEADDEDSPAYWQRRREYYYGRGEFEKALEAARRELALCPYDTLLERSAELPPTSKMDRTGTLKAQRRHRCSVLLQVSHVLWRLGRHDEAIDVLVDEIATRPAAEDFSAHLAQRAAELLPSARKVRTERHGRVLWTFVMASQDWDHAVSRVLRALFDHPTAGGLPDRPWDRLEDAAKGADPHRGLVLAGALGTGEAERKIRVLEEVYGRLEPGELRTRAGSSLFWTLQENRRWKDAERYWPDRVQQLTHREIPRDLATLAVCAAKAGALEDALRLWRQVANLDRTHLGGLDDLAEAGLRQRLVTFYEALAKHDPASVAPARALAILVAKDE